jgi:hypothetical protein
VQETAPSYMLYLTNDGSVVVGGTTAKQSTAAGGREKLSFQQTGTDAAKKVCVANFVGTEPAARLLIDMQGNHEWAGPGNGTVPDPDQNVLVGWLNLGRLQCQGLGEGGFSLHAWKHSTLTADLADSATATTVDVADASQFPDPTDPMVGQYTVRCGYELMTATARDVTNKTLTVATRTNHMAHSQGDYITATGKDEDHSRIELNFNKVDNVSGNAYGAEIAFSDGTHYADNAYLSRPFPNQILLRGNLATQRVDITLANTGNDNIDLGGASFIKVTGPSAGFTVTGFKGGSDGRILRLYNATFKTMTIANSKTSDLANQILTLTGNDLPLRAGAQSCATFIYDSGQSKWILVATN